MATSKRLDGQIILVTAAAQGIGRASAKAFAREGAKVIATDINFDKLKYIESASIQVKQLDVTDDKAIQELADSIEKVDCLMNCVGQGYEGNLLGTSVDDFDGCLRVNLRSMFVMTKSILPKMLKAGRGSIINVGSACVLKIPQNRCAYVTSKAAIWGFSNSIALDYAPYGIRCNCLTPGATDSESMRERLKDPNSPDQGIVEALPMGRMGRPEEMAAMCVYLASDESAYTTGHMMIVDGAFSL